MKLDKKILLEHFVSKDNLRELLTKVYFTGTQLVATNGYKMIVADVISFDKGEEYLKPMLIDPAVFPEARKYSRKGSSTYNIYFEENEGRASIFPGNSKTRVKVIDSWEYEEDLNATYPNYKSVIPKDDSPDEIHLNIEMLTNIVKSTGAKEVTLTVTDNPTQALKITSRDSESFFVLQMPLKKRG